MLDLSRPTRRPGPRQNNPSGSSLLLMPVSWLVRTASYATGIMTGTAMRLIIGSGISRRIRLRKAAEMYPMPDQNRLSPRGDRSQRPAGSSAPADRRQTLRHAVMGSSRQLIVAALGLPPTVAMNRISTIPTTRMNLWVADTWYYPLDSTTGAVMAIAFEANIARRVDVVDLSEHC